MAITPPADSKFNLTAAMPFTPHPAPKREVRAEDAPDAGASIAEREGMRRVETVNAQVTDAERDARQRLDGLKDEYVRASGAEADRAEVSLESQRIKGYEQVRELQRAQQAELARTRREGDQALKGLQDYYRDATYGAEQRGKEELGTIQSNYARNTEYQQKTSEADSAILHDENDRRLQGMIDETNRNYDALTSSARAKYETAKTNADQSTADTQKKFLDRYDSTVTQQNETIQGLETKAAQRVRDVRVDTSRKLAAYNERQKDPFYQMMDLGARLTEDESSFTLRATIPDHERQHVSIAIRGDEVVVSGQRRNEEKLELSPGHKQSTAAFQAYSESFPLHWPVDSRRVSRTFEGDELVVTIPKKAVYSARAPYQAKPPERAKAERPQFPDNLPHVGPESLPNPNPDDPEAKRPVETSGGRTLG